MKDYIENAVRKKKILKPELSLHLKNTPHQLLAKKLLLVTEHPPGVTCANYINPLPNKKYLEWSKLKAFADKTLFWQKFGCWLYWGLTPL